jgi:hypothetical protein
MLLTGKWQAHVLATTTLARKALPEASGDEMRYREARCVRIFLLEGFDMHMIMNGRLKAMKPPKVRDLSSLTQLIVVQHAKHTGNCWSAQGIVPSGDRIG